MGKYPKARQFRDHDRKQDIIVQRHLTYRRANSGFQVFFDADSYASPFVIAYMGKHLPYASNRS